MLTKCYSRVIIVTIAQTFTPRVRTDLRLVFSSAADHIFDSFKFIDEGESSGAAEFENTAMEIIGSRKED